MSKKQKKQRRIEIFLISIFILVSLFSISSAKDDKTRFFDISDEKIYDKRVKWDRVNFYEDRVVVLFKATTRDPILTKSDFNFSNIDRIEYENSRPEGNTGSFRQLACIYLKEKGRSKVIEAVDYFSALEIVKSATPDIIYNPDDYIDLNKFVRGV